MLRISSFRRANSLERGSIRSTKTSKSSIVTPRLSTLSISKKVRKIENSFFAKNKPKILGKNRKKKGVKKQFSSAKLLMKLKKMSIFKKELNNVQNLTFFDIFHLNYFLIKILGFFDNLPKILNFPLEIFT